MQLALPLRVNEAAEALGMDSHDDKGTVSALRRARTSGRFQRTAVAHWREREGVPVRSGRPSAVTPELAEVALQLLRDGASVEAMCERIGIAKSSWYRWVHHHAQGRVRVRRYVRVPRHPRSIKAELVRQMVALDRQGLARVLIAERLGLHINTVVKYLLREGRPRKR
jgi:IS30 family transposase